MKQSLSSTPVDRGNREWINSIALRLIDHCQEQGCGLEFGIKDFQCEMPGIDEQLANEIIDEARTITINESERSRYDDH